MVFNQKPRKPIMFTANAHKNAQGYCQPNKDSICYNVPLHTHDEDHFHHPQILKLASGTHTEGISNRDKKHNQIYQKVTKKLLHGQNINNQINSRFMTATELQPLRKGPYQIIDEPTEVTYKPTDSSKKEIVQHRKNLLPYYPKEYELRELTQLYFFTSLHIVQNNSQMEQNQNVKNKKNQKTIQQQNANPQKSNTPDPKISQRERKNRKMAEKTLPQDQQEKSKHKESSRLRSEPRKNYKTFIPQSKILKKVEFRKQI